MHLRHKRTNTRTDTLQHGHAHATVQHAPTAHHTPAAQQYHCIHTSTHYICWPCHDALMILFSSSGLVRVGSPAPQLADSTPYQFIWSCAFIDRVAHVLVLLHLYDSAVHLAFDIVSGIVWCVSVLHNMRVGRWMGTSHGHTSCTTSSSVLANVAHVGV